MQSFIRFVSTALCVLILAFVIPTQLAFAATQSGGSNSSHRTQAGATTYYDCGGTCENQDPYTTGCGSLSNGAYMANAESIIDQSGTKLAMIANWYSPECGTNWNETDLYASIATKVSIFRTNALPTYCYPTDCTSFYTQTASPLWTNMAYAPDIQAYATTTAQSPNDHLYYTVSIGA